MKNKEPVVVFVPDLFFQAKILATAKATGISVHLIGSAEEVAQECRRQPGSVVILDLAPASVDPIDLIKRIKKDSGTEAPSIVGFYSHVDKALERRAREAGCDFVLPRSVFSKRLPEILTGALSIG